MANETEWLKIGMELVGLAAGALAIIYTLKGDVKTLGERMDVMEREQRDMATKVDVVSQLFVQFARFDERFNHVMQQQNALTARVDELAHGKGFVVPFKLPEH